ncbi:MAG: hypothetical protein ACLFMX_02835 [Halobacteriales archaeon]
MTSTVQFRCHDCEHAFEAEVENDHGTYEFHRCPRCSSAKTTLA